MPRDVCGIVWPGCVPISLLARSRRAHPTRSCIITGRSAPVSQARCSWVACKPQGDETATVAPLCSVRSCCNRNCHTWKRDACMMCWDLSPCCGMAIARQWCGKKREVMADLVLALLAT